MKFDDKTLEEWFLEKSALEFPEKFDYVTKYKAIKQAVERYLSDATRGGDESDGISLTWHDNRHNETVIKRATKLLSYDGVLIKPYEAYYLLVAIQIHDLGNIKGRDDHEARAIDLLDTVYTNLDSTERNIINDIVETHSGSIDGDKDKIRHLKAITTHVDDIHTRFLAAILRFADELADEPRRASMALVETGKIKEGSEIFHVYAWCLTTTYIRKDNKIGLNFTISKEIAKKQYGKFVKEKGINIRQYVLDEIFERTKKVHIECIYCMRYLRPAILIDTINVSIEIIPQGLNKKISPIEYELVERGYPEAQQTIYELTGKQLLQNGGMWTGEKLKEIIIAKLENG